MIEGYLGRVGAGKTYCMVARASKFIGKRPIYGNFHPPENNKWFEPFTNLEDMLGIRNALILMDEIGLWFGARKWKEVPDTVLSYFAQSRKNGVDLWFTSQSEMQVESTVRRLTATYWSCARYGPFICARGNDPMDPKQHVFARQWFRLRPQVYNLYDTYEIVGGLDGAGYARGARGQAKASEWLERVKAWYVREEYVKGRVRWRPFEPLSDLRGVDPDVVCRQPSVSRISSSLLDEARSGIIGVYSE